MANLIKTYSWNFNSITEQKYEQEDVKIDISSWINDSVNFFSGKGHFSHLIKSTKLISGTRVKIGQQFYMIGQILGEGNSLGDIYIFKENPVLDRIYHIYGTNINSSGAHLKYLNYSDVYDGPSFIESLYGTGNDGDLDVNTTLQINKYSYLIGSFYGTDYIDVHSSIGFNIGDEVLLFQTQYSDFSRSGQYEFQKIINIQGNRIYFEKVLSNSYYDSTIRNNYSNPCKCAQLIRVPNYNNINITSSGKLVPKAWDGFSGGLLCFRVKGTLINNGIIEGSNCGFRGGYRSVGEGILGPYFQSTTSGRGYNYNLGGGGGYTGSLNCPGAGGGYATAGEGGNIAVSGLGFGLYASCPGGISILSSHLRLIGLGSGGGGTRSGVIGGRGAGSGLFCIKTCINNGSILFDGQVPKCSAGSGSGGGLILYCENLYQYGTISCMGGARSCSPSGAKFHSNAGKGSDGRLVISSDKIHHNSQTSYKYGTYFTPTTIQDFVMIGKLPTTLTVPTLIPYYIKSTQVSTIDIRNIQRLDKIEVIRTFPNLTLGSYIKLILSFNSGKSWLTWDGLKWIEVQFNEIASKGISVDVLDTLNSFHYLKPGCYTRDIKFIDFAITIQSGDKFDSPKITKINVIGSERSWRPFGIKVPRQINTVNIGKVFKFMKQS